MSLLFSLAVQLFVVFVLLLSFPFMVYAFFRNSRSESTSFFSGIVLGHRGAMGDKLSFPENSISSFDYAFEKGAHGIELDIQLTKCQELVVFHDSQTLDRVLKVSNNHQKRKITELTYDEAVKFQFRKGSKKDVIPLFEDVVKKVHEYHRKQNSSPEEYSNRPKFKMMIEVKEFRFLESMVMARKICQIFKRYPFLYTNSVVGSFNPFVLYIIRKMNPKVVTNLLYWRNLMSYYLYEEKCDVPELSMILRYRNEGKNRFLEYICPIFDVIYNFSMMTWLPSFIGAGMLGFGVDCIRSHFFLMFLKVRGFGVNIWGVETKEKKDELLSFGVSVTTDSAFD